MSFAVEEYRNGVRMGSKVVEDGVELARLIEVSPEDGRDGLFIGSWFSQSELVQHTLMKEFQKWEKCPSWGSGTGEMQALQRFRQKWSAQ